MSFLLPEAPGAALVDGIDAVAVAAAVRGCAGVSALDGGPFGEVAVYLPGRTVPGVAVADIDDPPVTSVPIPQPGSER